MTNYEKWIQQNMPLEGLAQKFEEDSSQCCYHCAYLAGSQCTADSSDPNCCLKGITKYLQTDRDTIEDRIEQIKQEMKKYNIYSCSISAAGGFYMLTDVGGIINVDFYEDEEFANL